MAVSFNAKAQEVETWSASSDEFPENKTIVLPSITMQFLDNTSKGSTAGAGTWAMNKTDYLAANQNGCEIKLTPSKNGTIKFEFAQTIAINKSFNMYVDDNTEMVMNGKLADGTTVVNAVNLEKQDPAITDAQGEISYELAKGHTYNFYAGGTKYRIKEITYTVSADQTEKEPETAGIVNVNAAEENAPIYNLQGVQVDENYKGIVIKNGKKYINK